MTKEEKKGKKKKMELKTKYQYTYFIYPFAVKENKYQKYILKLLKDKRFSLKIYEKEKDLRLYRYFSPKMSELLFTSFSLTNKKINKLQELPKETVSAILAKYPCTIFEYNLKKDIQGKTENKGIFFKIQKLELICFKNGICFLLIKTNIENSESFLDVLNFNYKFREIKQGDKISNSFDKIYLQTDTFSSILKLAEFIESISGSKFETLKLDIDTEKFFTYSYVCVNGQGLNEQKDFDDMEYYFDKFSNFLSADNTQNLKQQNKTTFSEWKYAKFGITKQGITLFTSDNDINNYTILPDIFENEYLYTYILNLYKKITLKKLENEFANQQNIKKVKRKFIEFIKNIWIQDFTDDEIGSILNLKIGKILELDRLYYEVKNKYDIYYKEHNMQKNMRLTTLLIVIVIILLIFVIFK